MVTARRIDGTTFGGIWRAYKGGYLRLTDARRMLRDVMVVEGEREDALIATRLAEDILLADLKAAGIPVLWSSRSVFLDRLLDVKVHSSGREWWSFSSRWPEMHSDDRKPMWPVWSVSHFLQEPSGTVAENAEYRNDVTIWRTGNDDRFVNIRQSTLSISYQTKFPRPSIIDRFDGWHHRRNRRAEDLGFC